MTPAEAESMYRERFPAVCKFVRKLGAGSELAEEVAQDSFTRILSLPNLAGRQIKSSYWIRAAQSVYRRQARRKMAGLGYGFDKAKEPEPDLPTFRLDSLPNREYEAVRFVCSGMTYDQTGLAMGETKTNVTNLKHRGVQRLRSVTFSE